MPQILGVKIDAVSRPQALAIVDQMLRHGVDAERPNSHAQRGDHAQRGSSHAKRGGQHIITTPNPEMLVAAREDKEFCEALNRAALALPDGVGLVFASWFLNLKLQGRIAGSDFVMDLMELAANKGYSVYFLGGKQGIAQSATEKLKIKYKKLKIVGVDSGSQQLEIENCKLEIASVCNARPDILLVAFGHGKQEKWIAQHLHELPSVKVAMGVGGVYDFISGNIRRAPTLFRNLGLEWLWRLLRQPRRIKRIWNAVVVFPLLVLKEKMRRRS